ncbi:MAG: hypothetical protein JSS69_13985 [Acidobacteria bacterium]|nr:hypothetical protein [Acidobacteriota bacterium]MBS1867020.1 hypothetical protein [Acidobacteriota bacterium]
MIRSLKPNVTQDEALRTFRATGFSSLLWRMRTGPLQRIAEAYVPFRLYRVRYAMNRERVQRIFAMDAVDGSLDLFEFRTIPEEGQFVTVESRNCLPGLLDEVKARQVLRDKVLRIVFQQGFFKLRDASLEIEAMPAEIYLPYWLGFYGASNSLRCRVMDAVRRRIEGAKASTFFEQWLAA